MRRRRHLRHHQATLEKQHHWAGKLKSRAKGKNRQEKEKKGKDVEEECSISIGWQVMHAHRVAVVVVLGATNRLVLTAATEN